MGLDKEPVRLTYALRMAKNIINQKHIIMHLELCNMSQITKQYLMNIKKIV